MFFSYILCIVNREAQQIIQSLKEFNLTEVDIASKLRMSYSSVYSYLKGKRNPSHFVVDKLKQILRGYQKRKTE